MGKAFGIKSIASIGADFAAFFGAREQRSSPPAGILWSTLIHRCDRHNDRPLRGR
jgi:hypothetical protein